MALLLHQRQLSSMHTCLLHAFNNACGEALLGEQALFEAAASLHTQQLNKHGEIVAVMHGTQLGDFTVSTLQAAVQQLYGRRFVIKRVPALTERNAVEVLQQRTTGSFIVMEWNNPDSYHFIALRADLHAVIDSAHKHIQHSSILHSKCVVRAWQIIDNEN
jgi:hypothetical protein